jgi:3-methyladenine DNA glycosylase AlkC
MTTNPKAFKHGLGSKAVLRIADNILVVEPTFAKRAFVRDAMTGLEALELKARVMHIAEMLRRHLPNDVVEAIEVLVHAGNSWDKGDPSSNTNSFAAWPVIEFVGVYGVEHFDVAMSALRQLTPLFSAEFAIRPIIEHHQAPALKLLASWTQDPNPHVRRLVSEGTRPRLPWGRQLKKFQQDPRPVLKLLEKLKDDTSEYVRRSVANNLNDITKDHADVVIDVCRRWSKNASTQRQWIIERATRTLVKQGNPEALKLLGFDPHSSVVIEAFTLKPNKLEVGEDLSFSFVLRSTSKQHQSLNIDFAIHHVRQSGARSPKVFKLKTLDLEGKGSISVVKIYKFRNITTRKYYSGRQALEIFVNGVSHAFAEFELIV